MLIDLLSRFFKAMRPVDNWRNIAISLIDQRSKREMAWLRQLVFFNKATSRTFSSYCSFAYSALASFRMGMSGSASFQSVRKSL
jgi:hypothetical protein